MQNRSTIYRMDEQDILARVGRMIDDHNATMRRVGEIDKILRFTPQTLAELVGDPSTHPVREYFERVTALSRNFHSARREALLKVKKHGKVSRQYQAGGAVIIAGAILCPILWMTMVRVPPKWQEPEPQGTDEEVDAAIKRMREALE